MTGLDTRSPTCNSFVLRPKLHNPALMQTSMFIESRVTQSKADFYAALHELTPMSDVLIVIFNALDAV